MAEKSWTNALRAEAFEYFSHAAAASCTAPSLFSNCTHVCIRFVHRTGEPLYGNPKPRHGICTGLQAKRSPNSQNLNKNKLFVDFFLFVLYMNEIIILDIEERG